MINKILLYYTKETLTLGFLMPGTTANLIMNLVKDEPYTFTELLVTLPRHVKMSSQDFKNTVAFLCNFGLIQSFTTTASALTFIVSDGPDHLQDHPVELDLDRIYHFADSIEPNLAYQMDSSATAIEFSSLS